MTKIEVITLHRVTNFGSLLQVYATETALKEMGYDVEIIDFLPEGLSFKRAVWPKQGSVVSKLIKFIPLFACNVYQYRMSDTFLKNNLSVSKKRFHNYNELLEYDFQTDIFLSGSDQIWNTQNNNPKEDLGAYYLAFAKDKPRVAYAGSFGRTSFSDKEKAKMKKWLEKYCAVSVREDTGLDILRELEIEGTHVLDPTFLLTKDEWTEFYLKNRKDLPEKGYVFVYNLNRNKLIEEVATEIHKRTGLRIINFADTFEFIRGAKNTLFNTPVDFLGCLINADYVITDSFHGTSFSLNLEKQFITVAAPKYNSRIESVLKMMNCGDRLINSLDGAMELCERNIDYNLVTPVLNMHRERSAGFLEDALNECTNHRE